MSFFLVHEGVGQEHATLSSGCISVVLRVKLKMVTVFSSTVTALTGT